MPRARPQRPRSARLIASAQVENPTIARAINDVVQAVREEQRDPKLPRSGSSGELYIRSTDGTMQPLAAGAQGEIMSIVDGSPSWVPSTNAGLPNDWGTVP